MLQVCDEEVISSDWPGTMGDMHSVKITLPLDGEDGGGECQGAVSYRPVGFPLTQTKEPESLNNAAVLR